MPILVAANFKGNMTRVTTGALDSGKCLDRTSFGYHPWSNPGCIAFTDNQADITGIITDLIIDGKTRVEGGIGYVYAVGHTGKLYKIQVNDPATKNITYDNPVLVATLATATSFTMGGSLMFFGDIPRIYIGHDGGVTSVNFDGTGEAFVGSSASWVQDVPRQGTVFFSKAYWTNGNNMAIVNPQGTVDTYTTMNSVPRDQTFKCVAPDNTGQNLILISSNVPNTSLVSTAPNIAATYGGYSYVYRWNARGNAIQSINTIYYDQTAALTSGNSEFIWGYDVPGGSMVDLSQGFKKIISGTGTYLVSQAPAANAVANSGNLTGWATVEPYPSTATSNAQGASVFIYGNLDNDEPDQIYARLINFPSSLASGDVIRCPWITIVDNIQTAGNTSGYGSGLTQNQTGTGRIYMSAIEYDGVNTAYKLYAFSLINPFLDPCPGVYETQGALVGSTVATGSTVTPTAVRVYMEPAAGVEMFKVDVIGMDGNPLPDYTNTFSPNAGDTVLTGVASGAATPSVGIRVTNAGPFTPFIHKIELTY